MHLHTSQVLCLAHKEYNFHNLRQLFSFLGVVNKIKFKVVVNCMNLHIAIYHYQINQTWLGLHG